MVVVFVCRGGRHQLFFKGRVMSCHSSDWVDLRHLSWLVMICPVKLYVWMKLLFLPETSGSPGLILNQRFPWLYLLQEPFHSQPQPLPLSYVWRQQASPQLTFQYPVCQSLCLRDCFFVLFVFVFLHSALQLWTLSLCKAVSIVCPWQYGLYLILGLDEIMCIEHRAPSPALGTP